MIIILDDTFHERSNYSDVSFLEKDEYNEVCVIYQNPTIADLPVILNQGNKTKLICNHRSLKLFNDNKEEVEGANYIQSLIKQIDEKKIERIEFGRDAHTNLTTNTIDKALFYENLQAFLNHFIETKEIEKKVLYYGLNYLEVERLNHCNKLFDRIRELNSVENIRNDKEIRINYNLVFPELNFENQFASWVKKELSIREIIEQLNKSL